jgi:hypothetical protein
MATKQAGVLPQLECDPTSSSSSSSSGEWPDGAHNYHPYCRVCQQELTKQRQQQQQHTQTSSSSSAAGGCTDPVHYADPFMWRRLLWQLLGKLSPEAQAFYAQHLAACPHCPDEQ